ncbi:cytosolic carboxypeptidase-like protein 5 isoform X1 [Spodoptera litura]|uniref:Cytosolic carboxypeptidase-like protein 5 isoform X1 n=1 Tax=Spodoptera litura TaxID=69820 RepID=A0A9J7IVW7_SPOLT|nr:cytosolic carboxypeptidase-like protein 5 isoform X1 [Spodoptera litura]
MDQNNIIECGGFYFIHNFDSGNLGHVERVPTELIAPSVNPKTNLSETPDYEFNMWTRPDCAGTEFENGNRTWFYFGVQASEAGVLVRLNLINLNKQGKMYNQGMAPVTRTLPGKPQWERIRDRPVHSTDDNTFTLSFKYRTSENLKATTFFAFTYPFSFAELQIALNSIDLKMLPLPPPQSQDDIYYVRECLIYSLEGRRVDLLTITSHHGITSEREERLKNLFPDNQERPHKFVNKKVIFISARVHPGETPSSFVFNGFLNLLLTRNDPIAIQLRKIYVFKMVPFLNPDGVARGHYRTDTRGVNLNRVYLNPSLALHPTVYASRALIRYYHYGSEKEDLMDESKSYTSRSIQNISESSEVPAHNPQVIDTKKKKGNSNPQPYKGGDYYKREKHPKPMTSQKSSTTIKPPSTSSDISKKEFKSLSGEAAHLAEQVYDMKLQEQPSQTSDTSSKPSNSNIDESPSLLNDNMLRTCLGSTVHLSTSEELNFHGSNPLRPLRDTLKNSISLLMESNTSVTGDSALGSKESRQSNVKMGWCMDCRLAVSKLEDTMPGITGMVPGYNVSLNRQDHLTYHTIDEYREHQRQQVDEQSKKDSDASSSPAPKEENLHFCTNCFKRYVITDSNEEIKVCSVVSTTSVAVSAADSADPRTDSHSSDKLTGTGDVLLVPVNPSPKEEKPKSPTTKAGKKKGAPVPTNTTTSSNSNPVPKAGPKEADSGLYLYIDLHGHASKKGIFMYGNHFDDLESCVECMLLPRIMSMNNLHFHFSSCNFTERNMYLKDRRDGMSREGSGRVAVFKATGLVRSYTLECNYNTGRLVNVLPPAVRDAAPAPAPAAAPPKYTPHIFEEVNPFQVGRSLGASILDLTGQHPNSRIPCSEHRNLSAVREWLRAHTRTMRPQLTMSRLRPKTTSPPRVPLYARSKGKVTEERKENTYVGAKTDSERKRSPPVLAPRSGHDIMNLGMKFSKKNEPVKTASRTRYLSENEPKPKTLSTKRRNILAIRKPNSSKTAVGGVVKTKASRRSADDAESPRTSIVSGKLSKRSYSRSVRGSSTRSRALASSSSDELLAGAWEDVAGGTALGAADGLALPAKRRPFPAPAPPPHLKKIRLKQAM